MEQPPIIASIDDIDRQFAERAFHGTSFRPEARGESRRKEYAEAVNGLYAELWPVAKTEEQKVLLAAEMERYREGYLSRMKAWLASHSNVMSAMIVGPARFPTARNQKRGQWADNKLADLCEWEKKARQAIKRKLLDARPEEEKAAEDWRRLANGIKRSLAAIHEIDTVGSPFNRAAFVNSIAGKVERLASNGELDLVQKALKLVRDYNAQNDKPAISDRHAFWTYEDVAKKRAARMEEDTGSDPDAIAEAGGVRIVANHSEDRVQIFFPEKPNAEMIAKLKGEAWNWSPRNGAWQRKLTEAAKQSAKRIVGA